MDPSALSAWGRTVTLLLADEEMAEELPEGEYREYFGPDYLLHIGLKSDVENLNTPAYLESLRIQLLQNISQCCALVTSMRMHHWPACKPFERCAG